MKRFLWILTVTVILTGALPVHAEPGPSLMPAQPPQQFTHPKLQMTVIQAEYKLPAGDWRLTDRDALKGLRHIQWTVPPEARRVRGDRFAQVQGEQVQGHISGFYWMLHQHALRHADYRLTLEDFSGDRQAPLQLVNSVAAELGLTPPLLASAEAALEWLNTSATPYRICAKFMDQSQFTYPDYAVLNEVRQKFRITKLDELNDKHFAELTGTTLGYRFTRAILKKRYKLNFMATKPERLVGPAEIAELDEHQRRAFYRRAYDPINGHYQEEESPQYFLVPGIELIRGQKDKDHRPLVLELFPFVDDGKHWVLFNDGTSERVDVDQELVRQYSLTVTPLRQPEEDPEQTYYFAAQVITPEAHGPWTMTVRNTVTGEQQTLVLTREDVHHGDAAVFKRWSAQRAQQWASRLTVAPSTVYMTWLSRYPAVYEDKAPENMSPMTAADRRGRTTSVLNMLGGRAAIEETLQMTNLTVNTSASLQSRPLVPLRDIEGVTVKAHDYAAMLDGDPGGRLELADYVPPDRFFAYFADPGAMSGYLQDGIAFVHQFGADAFGNRLNYDLKERYYARLGLDGEWVDRFLKSGFVSEMALMTPDLFFIDGTDVTLIVKVPQLKLISPLLRLAGVSGLKPGKVLEKKLTDGRGVYWSTAGRLLIVSTHRQEINAVWDLISNAGDGSLGRSAEFRYMLTQLPPAEDTKMFAYFSDPFIRRMTGPEVKIGQFRRLKERARLESMTAGGLLYKIDGHRELPTLVRLAELGYISTDTVKAGDVLLDNLAVRSAQFGTARDMTTILDMNLAGVYPEEAKAYKDYVENYSRFWRQFFDPIAIRYDKDPQSASEINVFILPLIDSTIYEGARTVLNGVEAGKVLRHPVFSPEPVLAISANINEETWVQVVKGFSFLKKYTSLDTAVFDEFGPSLHVVVEDADPVINLGSGDFLGLMGAGQGMQVFRARESLWMPIAFMMFTRPTKIMFELKDEEKVRGFLRAVSSLREWDRPRDWGRTMVDFTQVEDRDEWNCRIGLFGILSLRYGIRVQDGYLVFSNVPWSQNYVLDFSDDTALESAAVTLNPGAAERQLPGLYNSALDRMSAANRRSMVYLSPLMELYPDNVHEAEDRHRELFGFIPLHAGRGEWEWRDGELSSTTFGSLWDRRRPAYEENDRDFGLLREFQNLSVSMQFEDDGLRTRIRWTPRE